MHILALVITTLFGAVIASPQPKTDLAQPGGNTPVLDEFPVEFESTPNPNDEDIEEYLRGSLTKGDKESKRAKGIKDTPSKIMANSTTDETNTDLDITDDDELESLVIDQVGKGLNVSGAATPATPANKTAKSASGMPILPSAVNPTNGTNSTTNGTNSTTNSTRNSTTNAKNSTNNTKNYKHKNGSKAGEDGGEPLTNGASSVGTTLVASSALLLIWIK